MPVQSDPHPEQAAVMSTLGFVQISTEDENVIGWSYWNGDRADPAHGFSLTLAQEAKPAASWVVAEVITKAFTIGESRRGKAIKAQLKKLLS